ncbi:MAG: heparinase II/III domain-containing protein, partial [Gemmatimonadales bacterium]
QAPLSFDPWSPDAHRCPRCGRTFSGERHHAHWARAQHLWIAERAAHLATIYAVTDDAAAGERARQLLAAYYDLYFELPNSDNVLGPSHLFFSTYLESMWLLNYLAAAFMLRETNTLDDNDIRQVDAIADEAATIIAEFNEAMSNRQTWNSAALTAIATWFGDEELAVTAIESRTGLVGHLADGFGTDGMWWEGENYHLFALRGLLIGLQWAHTAGADVLASDEVTAHLGQALMAPADTALPDLTFPARKDARYGVSLAQPAYIECWEWGYATLSARAPAELPAWLRALYAVPTRPELTYDAYLHDAGEQQPGRHSRSDLSWWALLTMAPALATDGGEWIGPTRLLEQQGLAILRHGTRYASLECGGGGAGHGHPDRLQFTLYAGGVHWLPDPGTGSYVTHDLFWYRSTLAHNAPLLDGVDQPATDSARCAAFATSGDWTWSVGVWGSVRRTVVAGPEWILDVVHLESDRPCQLDLPWHLAGDAVVHVSGAWQAEPMDNEFVSELQRLVPEHPAFAIPMSTTADHGVLRLLFAGDGDLLRANGPGIPGSVNTRPFYLRRSCGNRAIFVTVLDTTGSVTAIDHDGSLIRVHEGDMQTTVQLGTTEAAVVRGAGRIVLGGARSVPMGAATFIVDRPPVTTGQAIWIESPPPLDGSATGFNRSVPLMLTEEYQYFRSETPYADDGTFTATAHVNWSD